MAADAVRSLVCSYLGTGELDHHMFALRASGDRHHSHEDGFGASHRSRRDALSVLPVLMMLPNAGSKLMLPPDFENEEEEERAREELDKLRAQLRDVRRLLLENKHTAMDEFERRRKQLAIQA